MSFNFDDKLKDIFCGPCKASFLSILERLSQGSETYVKDAFLLVQTIQRMNSDDLENSASTLFKKATYLIKVNFVHKGRYESTKYIQAR